MGEKKTSGEKPFVGPRRLIGRIAGAVLVASLGYFATSFSLAQALATDNPSLAYQLAPYNGRVEAMLAASLSTTVEATVVDRQRADAIARRALIHEPLAVVAASTLGLNADARGDRDAARRAFNYAERLTRRNLQAQLWQIESAVGRSDITSALYHYDVALRTNPTSAGLLFPVLATASADATIRDALVLTLLARPSWGDEFASFVATRGSNPGTTATFFAALAARGVSVPAEARTRVIDALVMAGRVSEAWAFYVKVHPGSDPRRSRDPSFVQGGDAPSRFDWVPIKDGIVSATLGGGSFDFSMPVAAAGPLLEQLQILPSGDYRLIGRGEILDKASGAKMYWSLTCVSGSELGRVEIDDNGRFAGALHVPAGCPSQKLILISRPSDAVIETSGRISRAALVPLVP